MKSVIVIVAVALVATGAFAQTSRRVDYNDGRYYPDNSGQYNGNDGRYHPDESGQYKPDGSGGYAGGFDKYKHQADQFGNGDGGAGGFGSAGNGAGRFGSAGSGAGRFGNTGRFGGADSQRLQGGLVGVGVEAVPVSDHVAVPVPNRSNIKSYSPVGEAAYKYGIIRKVENVESDGYHYLYETENGITGEEQGKLANVGTDNEGMRASGFFKYTGPDNVVYTVEYTADENGFVPSGVHIPTPPPIPEAILRSLEYQRSLGEL